VKSVKGGSRIQGVFFVLMVLLFGFFFLSLSFINLFFLILRVESW
jgi:hypothetical protein